MDYCCSWRWAASNLARSIFFFSCFFFFFNFCLINFRLFLLSPQYMLKCCINLFEFIFFAQKANTLRCMLKYYLLLLSFLFFLFSFSLIIVCFEKMHLFVYSSTYFNCVVELAESGAQPFAPTPWSYFPTSWLTRPDLLGIILIQNFIFLLGTLSLCLHSLFSGQVSEQNTLTSSLRLSCWCQRSKPELY